ncbi:Iron-sulfur cluster assembly protein SufD [hydrothermal vent metagenome]|uniref:Iron-sulfur cluster assembly protein SufD n=1 Tax=hydrothermal vent metagenome TaxID=652676 RepID=A0A3B0UD76_9ZZZZ
MGVVVENTDLSLKLAGHFNDVKEKLFLNSPDIINAHRQKALQDFVSQGIPTRKNESYKYTNLQPPFMPDYTFIHEKREGDVALHEIFKCDVPQLDTYMVLLQNGWFYGQDSQTGELPEGVIMDSLENVAKKQPELIEKYYAALAKSEDDPLIALNTAFAKDGYLLYIPADVEIAKPIQIINLLKSGNDAFITQRNLVIAEPGAKVNLIICDHTLNGNKYLSNSVTEIHIGGNAQVDYYVLQNQHNDSASLNTVCIRQGNDSIVRTNTVSLHGGLIRNSLKVVLDGENAEAGIFGMAFMDRRQHIDNFTRIIHAKPHCQSTQVYKNVMDDKSSGAFSGLIHVVRDAQKINASQRNNNLLLTDEATMHTKPQLIIDADDVKCSHGATVGQIDNEALFYLRTRGIGEKEAMLMMMNAFTHEVVQEIKVVPLRERIDELISRRLNGEVARCHECAYDCDS